MFHLCAHPAFKFTLLPAEKHRDYGATPKFRLIWDKNTQNFF